MTAVVSRVAQSSTSSLYDVNVSSVVAYGVNSSFLSLTIQDSSVAHVCKHISMIVLFLLDQECGTFYCVSFGVIASDCILYVLTVYSTTVRLVLQLQCFVSYIKVKASRNTSAYFK